MSIRIKLILLVLLTGLAGGSSVLINQWMMGPVRRIEMESVLLDELNIQLYNYAFQVNRLNVEIFLDQVEQVADAKVALEKAFSNVEGMQFLPSINDSLGTSIETITLFSSIIDTNHGSLETRLDDVADAAFRLFDGDDQYYTVLQMLWADTLEDESLNTAVTQSIFFLDSSCLALNNMINATIENLETQEKIIAAESQKFISRAQGIVSIVILLVVLIPLILALIIANLLASRIKKIEVGIARMMEGDLADRIEINSRDEMGRLSGNINNFTDSLGESMLRIKESSGRNFAMKEDLLSSVEKVSRATEKAGVSVQSITGEMVGLDQTVRTTAEAVGIVEDRLEKLESVLQEQVTMIEETNAAISQMIASIGNVGEITIRKKTAMSELVNLASQGGTKLQGTNEVISRIHDSIEEIRSTAKIIAGIASRTNLLAMNAAIEAAHAGDAGRGFAVVADEIRKLAEASASNSKHIDGVMSAIVGNIEEAAESGRMTGGVFEKIDREVGEATQSFEEIAGSMAELKVGGNQILDAMVRLNDITGEVKEDGTAIGDAAEANRRAIEEVNRISESAASRVQDISAVLELMRTEMETVSTVSQKADTISKSLEKEVATYRTEDLSE